MGKNKKMKPMSHLFECDQISCEYQEYQAPEPHGLEVRCDACNKWIRYLPKPGNEKKRRDKNAKHRKKWRRLGFVCGRCGDAFHERTLKESDWHCDHIQELRHGGADLFSNTQMLCKRCHKKKTREQYAK
jgi:5-methylcytosine-specific restriction endonuclease McrA